MKLLFCRDCHDVVKLQLTSRACACGKVSGQYRRDGAHADVSEGAEVIGIDNYTLIAAMRGHSHMLAAWVFDPATAERVHWPTPPPRKEQKNAWRQRRRESFATAQICFRCGENPATEYRDCNQCRLKRSKQVQSRYQSKKAKQIEGVPV